MKARRLGCFSWDPVRQFQLILGNANGIDLNLIAVFCRGYYDLALYALLNPIYWQLHSMDTYMALWQLLAKPFYWKKKCMA
ncbi:MAG: hypothetical protein Q6L68_15060 [Thermostichus sp. DG02_5_bins_236]